VRATGPGRIATQSVFTVGSYFALFQDDDEVTSRRW
jgi:hypothetical protein